MISWSAANLAVGNRSTFISMVVAPPSTFRPQSSLYLL
jgi:hypothetical protein